MLLESGESYKKIEGKEYNAHIEPDFKIKNIKDAVNYII
jgi:hypothetical protein